jgi:L-fuculose-phosphate aldolase
MQNYTRVVHISDFEARKTIIETGISMCNKNFAPSGSGRISLRVSPSEIWTTREGLSMGRLSHTDIIKHSLLNRLQARAPSPGTDAHLRIFAENPGINAVIHAHPPALTAFAVKGKSLESPELSALFGGAPLLCSSSPDAAAPY